MIEVQARLLGESLIPRIWCSQLGVVMWLCFMFKLLRCVTCKFGTIYVQIPLKNLYQEMRLYAQSVSHSVFLCYPVAFQAIYIHLYNTAAIKHQIPCVKCSRASPSIFHNFIMLRPRYQQDTAYYDDMLKSLLKESGLKAYRQWSLCRLSVMQSFGTAEGVSKSAQWINTAFERLLGPVAL